MPKPDATTEDSYALIGAGPAGLAGARNLAKAGVDFVGFEAHTGVGGLWDIENPRSTVYMSAHLISSRTTTAFAEFPMREDVPDYPDHRHMKAYFEAFADEFDLPRHYRFGTRVERVEPDGELWRVTSVDSHGVEYVERFRGVVIATGTLSEPSIPTFPGEFTGEVMHTATYKDPVVFEDKRVLIIGAGNSGCDIAVDAVHYADSVDMSVRSGYYFIPKYIFGKPADTLNQRERPLPAWLKTKVDGTLLRLLTGDPARFGFIKPDHRIYESHPILNTLVLHHAGHGDIKVRGDIARFAGDCVEFKDGTHREYDLVVLATGYKLHYPYVDPQHLNWVRNAPDLYLNVFTPNHRNLFVLGMIEAAGIGWQGRYLQAELVASFIKAQQEDPAAADELWARVHGPRPDLSGGYRYRQLDRMPYYVNKEAYTRAVKEHLRIVSPV
ncbi:MAG TPA: NAD(P)-binding domain-containing protein [Nocardioidaceae bacterium]|nr:NAD(P)-binding domain-containing protein [Nocardioidaceae bacterium]